MIHSSINNKAAKEVNPLLLLYTLSRFDYSERNAITGSFLDAIFAGISPAVIVRKTLIKIRMTAPLIGKLASPLTPDKFSIIEFAGMISNAEIPIPNSPAVNPMIAVSALNTLEISFLEAPILLKIPISFVLSRTEI